jgi:sialic acid synthase SpsE
MKTACLNGRSVGDGHPCFVSFELGATHLGLESAKRLCKAAADAGADAVKLQTVRAEELMSRDHDTLIQYQNASGTTSESVYGALRRRELSDDQWRALKSYCDDLGLLFISTPSGCHTIDLLAEMNVAAIKVAKADINHRILIEYIARKGLPVILDARERFEDVEVACEICEAQGIKDIIIMHCPSGYPSKHAGVHLRTIPQIKSIFGYPVAYSDHSVGSAMNFAAIAMGANFIEKTITEDRATDAVEHYMSLEISELAQFVQEIRSVEMAMGDPRIIFSSRVNAESRRSIVAAKEIRAGEQISLELLEFKRPGTKISVEKINEIVGQTAARDIAPGTYLSEADLLAS